MTDRSLLIEKLGSMPSSVISHWSACLAFSSPHPIGFDEPLGGSGFRFAFGVDRLA
jgi:hypothetical protein